MSWRAYGLSVGSTFCSARSLWPSVDVSMASLDAPSFDPGNTPGGELPPWEVAKAYAFSVVIDTMREITGKSVRSLLNATKAEFIAGQVKTVDGEHPCERAAGAQDM